MDMKKTIFIVLMLIGVLHAEAQQDAMYTHYMFNTLSVNPAYAGSRDALTVTGLHRSQWISFPGAPTTQTITLHTPAFNEQLGLGLTVINDKIGPTNTTSFYGDVTYRLKVSEKTKLGIGIKAGVNMFSGNFNSLSPDDNNDGVFLTDLKTKALPNFGIGLYLDGENYFVGLSSPNILENNFDGNTPDSVSSQFISAGVAFPLNEKIKLLPTGFIKMTNGAPIEGDVTARFLFNEKYWLGAMLRSGDAAGFLAGLQINRQLAIGYSFDFSFYNRTLKYNNGSHELMLRYDFIYKDSDHILSPRYF